MDVGLSVRSLLTFYGVTKAFAGAVPENSVHTATLATTLGQQRYNPGDTTKRQPWDNKGYNTGNSKGYNPGDNKGPTPYDVEPLTIWQSPSLAGCNQYWALMILPARS